MHDTTTPDTEPGSRRQRRRDRRHRRQRGIAVAMVGLLLIPMLIFAAFGVDLASWYARISELQRAADAAALAGAVWMPDIGEARIQANASLVSNGMHNTVDPSIQTSVDPGSTATSIRVTVTDHAQRSLVVRARDGYRSGGRTQVR